MTRLLRAGALAAAVLAATMTVSVSIVASCAFLIWLPMQFGDPVLRVLVLVAEVLVGIWGLVTLALWRSDDE